MTEFIKIIDDAWENKDQINQNSDKILKDTINQIIENLDSGKARVAEKINNKWITHQHIKKAIMLSFRIHGMETLSGPYSSWHDKAHLLKGKTAGWTKEDFDKAGFRMVPNSPVRKGSFVGKNAVLMPCYVNIGAYIGSGTMMDTFSRAGSCCQIGENCHISAGSGIGGVLEPAQALPTIIEEMEYLSMGEGPYYTLYRPYHLASVEAPRSVGMAIINNEPGLQPTTWISEVIGHAKKDLKPGDQIDGIGGFSSYGVAYPYSETDGLAPLGLIEGATVVDEVKQGEPIPRASLELPDNLINNLRNKQNN